MHQYPYGDSSDGVKWAKYVQGRRGIEAEDGLSLIKHYKGLPRNIQHQIKSQQRFNKRLKPKTVREILNNCQF